MTMASINKSYVPSKDDVELHRVDENKSKPDGGAHSYEEALDLCGHGRYNAGLLGACFVVITAMGVDIFGLGILVTAASCDLGLSLQQVSVLSSMPFAGIIVMSYPWGLVSDTRGRRRALRAAMLGAFAAAALSSLAPNWQTLAALRFISSALSSAAESATYALLGESCVRRVRARYMLLVTSALMLTPTLYYILGYLIMKLEFSVPVAGLALRPWRLLALAMALPLLLGALALGRFGESPKFLVNVGRQRDALAALTNIYVRNGGVAEHYPVKHVYLEEGSKDAVGKFSLQSLWTQIAPLFKPPLLWRTLLLYYLTFVIYIANNSFAIILPTIFNVFFTSLAASAPGAGAGFCDLIAGSAGSGHYNQSEAGAAGAAECADTINANTIWAGCAHGFSFFVLNALISRCAARRKILTIAILVVAAFAAVGIDHAREPVAGLLLFYVFLTTAMVFGVVSSYFVDLYPTSYRGMVACLGMMVARLSAFAGTNAVGRALGAHCAAAFYGAAALVLSGAVAAALLPVGELHET